MGRFILLSFAVVLGACSCSSEPAPTEVQPRSFHPPSPPRPPRGRSIPELIAAITDNPSVRRLDDTPAVEELVEIGEPALGPVIELLLSDDLVTRCCAKKVLAGITGRLYGYRGPNGWPTRADEDAWHAFWDSMGRYDPDADAEKRQASVKLWRTWLAERQKRP